MRAKVLSILAVLLVGIIAGSGLLAQQKKKPDKKDLDLTTQFAASDPDFKIQGEYEGELAGKGKFAAQVVAKGNGKFEVYFLSGGLPGAGWDKKTRTKVPAATTEKLVSMTGGKWTGTIANGAISGKTDAGDAFTLKRVERKSPRLGAKPPPGAIVLFDGTSADEWNRGSIVDGSLLYRGTTSKKRFAAGTLHLEFRTPYQPKAGGQGRGNSGVYILGKEIQVLDSFGLTGAKNECGAFYGQAAPAVNMCLPPLTWQTFDVEIKPDDKGDLKATVWHNGVKIHDDFPIAGKNAKPASINLQNHGNPVVYRNIWFLPAKQSVSSAEKPARPNIVFILVDDMGYADLGCYGAKDIRTPNIDRLAREGLKFSDFYANAPVCTPTRCGFMTGRWQQRVGVEWALGYTAEQKRRVGGKWVPEKDIHKLGMPESEVTIANLLKKAGYATGAFGKWHLGFEPRYNPIRRGFDEYFGTLLGHADYYRYNYYDGTNALRDGERETKASGYLTDLINRRAVEFVRKHAREPFFLYVPHLAVHAPYQPPDRPRPAVTKANMHDGDRKTYAAMLEKVDEGVGLLLAELDKLKLAENTLVVLASDNGGAPHFSDNSPLFNHKQTLWEGGIRVPCLMRWPGKLAAGKVIKQPAITMDLTATFLALAGGKPARNRPLDGIDLMPILTGKQPETTRTFFWRIDRSNRKQKAVRHGPWKYVQDGGFVDLLFDLTSDIGERKNLAFRHPEIVRDLKKRLTEWEKEMDGHEKEVMIR